MNLREQRELNNAAGESITKAFELVLTPAIFGLLGFFIDRSLGTWPLFTLLLGLAVFGYECWRQFVVYDQAMKRHDEGAPWARDRKGSADAG